MSDTDTIEWPDYLDEPMRRFFLHCAAITGSKVGYSIKHLGCFSSSTDDHFWISIKSFERFPTEPEMIVYSGDRDIMPGTSKVTFARTTQNFFHYWKTEFRTTVEEGRLTNFRQITLLTAIFDFEP